MKIVRLMIFLLFTAIPSHALNIIRDAEIELVLTDMVKSIFKVAELDEKSAKVFVFNSKDINAFTIGNGYIFVSSELLFKITDAAQLMGVLAHETAHIAAGHINRLMSTLQQQSRNRGIATLVGLIGTLATGSVDAMAASIGYIMADDRLFLRYSRGEEAAADALGASYMEKLGYSVNNMTKVFEMFRYLELMNGGEHVPEYIKSHPSPDNRIKALSHRNSPAKLTNYDELQKKYKRIRTKLRAYIKDELSIRDDYTEAVFQHLQGKSDTAIKILQDLLKKCPDDVFYKETLAQCYYESGKIQDALKLYKEIYTKKSHILIKISYAETLIAADSNLDEAISILESAKYIECFDDRIFHLLAIAYGKKQKFGLSYLALAREKMLLSEYTAAEQLIKKSIKEFESKKDQNHLRQAKYLKELIDRAK